MRSFSINVVGFIMCLFSVFDISAQEKGFESPYYKVLKSEKIDFKDPYKHKDFGFNKSFKIGNDECKKVNFDNKNGIFNVTQNQWVVNLQYKKVNVISDSLFHLKLFARKVKLMHLDPKSNYNLEGIFDIEVKEDIILLNAFTDNAIIYNRKSNNKINLGYNLAHLINDSLILVRNLSGINGGCNLIDFEGNLILKEWYKGISVRNKELFATIYGDNNYCSVESKIDLRTGDISSDFFSHKAKIRISKFTKDKFKVIYNNTDTLPFLVDTFFINNHNDLIAKIGEKYCILYSSKLSFLNNRRINDRFILVDSISHISNSYGIQIFNNKKSGLLNQFNRDLAKPQYEKILLFGNTNKERYVILDKNKISIYNYSNKLIKECPCDQPYSIASKKEKPVKELLVCFQKSGNVVAYDVNGNIVPKTEVWFTNENLDEVDINSLSSNEILRIVDKYGLISKEKKIIIPPDFDYVYKTSLEGVFLANETTFKDTYVHLMDIISGSKVSYPGYRLSRNNSNLKYVELIDRNFKSTYYEVSQNPLKLIPITFFDKIINPNSIILCKKDKYGMESLSGKTLINLKYRNCFQVSTGIIGCKDEFEKYAMFDDKGLLLTEFKFDSIVSLYWHILAIKKDTITIFNTNLENGTKLTQIKTISGYNFVKKNSLVFTVEKSGKFGIFDMNGNERLKVENDQIIDTRDYNSIFKRNGKFYFSASNDTEVFKNGVDTAFFFKNVQHQDDHGVVILKIGTKYGLHRSSLQFTEAIFDDIYEIHRDYLLVENDRKLGLYDIKRKTYILEPEYNGIFYKDKDNITVIKGNLLQTVSIN
ncbi:MAG: WG repeat-containing protein [Saprospiraceae bacterium]|nr:WG repeat-containing protein [Saprospiraceae bacterium]